MGIDIRTLFILYAILNFTTIFIFILFLFSIKERGDALVFYIITCFIIALEWFIAGSRNPIDRSYKIILSNGIVFLGIVYSFYALIIANQQFNLKEFFRASLLIVGVTLIFALFVKKEEAIRIAVVSLMSGGLYVIGALQLLFRYKISKLQAYVGMFALFLSLAHFYRFYYALKIDPDITLFKESLTNTITFILFFIENFSVGIIILMIHYEKSKKKIEKHNLMLIEVNATKDKILSIIAHDLRNFFNSILGLSHYLERAEDEVTIGSQRKKIKLINSAANSAFILLTNLLEWANTKTKKVVFEPRQFEIESLINTVLKSCKPEADIKEVALKVNYDEDLKVCADRNMVLTILRNLVLNAIKYSYKYNKIDILITRSNEEVLFEVIDSGIGMKKEEASFLMDEVNVISKPGTEKEKGSGLGLQICKGFLKQHNSELCIDSQPGKGSRFYFLLPKNCNA